MLVGVFGLCQTSPNTYTDMVINNRTRWSIVLNIWLLMIVSHVINLMYAMWNVSITRFNAGRLDQDWRMYKVPWFRSIRAKIQPQQVDGNKLFPPVSPSLLPADLCLLFGFSNEDFRLMCFCMNWGSLCCRCAGNILPALSLFKTVSLETESSSSRVSSTSWLIFGLCFRRCFFL